MTVEGAEGTVRGVAELDRPDQSPCLDPALAATRNQYVVPLARLDTV